MACCILIAVFLALLTFPFRMLQRLCGRDIPAVAWQPGKSGDRTARHGLIWLQARRRSFGHALDGLSFALRSQPHMKIHVAAAAVVLLAGGALRLPAGDWLWLIAAITIVLFAEAMNTAIEHLCDVVSPGPNPSVKRAKDVAAGAVLIVATAAAIIGTLVLAPHVLPDSIDISATICGASE